MEIITPRLRLIPATAARHRMELTAHDLLARELNATIPAAWPPENLRDALELFALDLDSRPELNGWRAWHWLANEAGAEKRILAGSGGFKGTPDAAGTVEIGYGTLEEFQGRGFATEAVHGLIAWAFQQPEITRITAEASPDNRASVRVLEKCGFAPIGPGSEAEHTLFERKRFSAK